jgi:chemosensory pili system protein ChpC
VAEVIPWQSPDQLENVPQWCLGSIPWNDHKVPVISFEGLCGKSSPISALRTRIVICVAISGRLRNSYFGLISQGFPQLMRLGPDVVKTDPNQSAFDRHPVLCRVTLINEHPFIPDFERIERMISEEVSY